MAYLLAKVCALLRILLLLLSCSAVVLKVQSAKCSTCSCFIIRFTNPEAETHEHTILLRILGIILRVLRLDVSLYNFLSQTSFQTIAQGGEWGGGGKNLVIEVTVNCKEDNS